MQLLQPQLSHALSPVQQSSKNWNFRRSRLHQQRHDRTVGRLLAIIYTYDRSQPRTSVKSTCRQFRPASAGRMVFSFLHGLVRRFSTRCIASHIARAVALLAGVLITWKRLQGPSHNILRFCSCFAASDCGNSSSHGFTWAQRYSMADCAISGHYRFGFLFLQDAQSPHDLLQA
jgi:hypothetical protein